ncbi:MAG: hypothetical protein MZU97_19685 [Bacillus subtilis]|nr:hypothetical protein [Bacillus subtilis]
MISDAARYGHSCENGKKLLRYVDAHQAILASVESRLVHFDLWDANFIGESKAGNVEIAWIDPERSFYGDRIADFVCLDFMHMDLDLKQPWIDRYNAHAKEPLVVTASLHLRFALMLGYLGVIMEVEKYADTAEATSAGGATSLFANFYSTIVFNLFGD